MCSSRKEEKRNWQFSNSFLTEKHQPLKNCTPINLESRKDTSESGIFYNGIAYITINKFTLNKLDDSVNTRKITTYKPTLIVFSLFNCCFGEVDIMKPSLSKIMFVIDGF